MSEVRGGIFAGVAGLVLAGVLLVGMPRAYARTLWEVAATPTGSEATVSVRVLGPTEDEKLAALAVAANPKASSRPFSPATNRSDGLALLLLGESVLVGVFVYVVRHGYQFGTSRMV